jgi:hypothetical protein
MLSSPTITTKLHQNTEICITHTLPAEQHTIVITNYLQKLNIKAMQQKHKLKC